MGTADGGEETVGGYTRSDRRWIAAAALPLLPFVAVRFFGVGAGSSFAVATVVGIAIVAAAFFLSWATEGLATVLSQSVALAILALIEVAPEYAFEILLAWRQQVELAAASMTGANRLLLGLGWPLIMFVAFLSARRRGQSFTEIRLDYRNSTEIVFLLVASVYAFAIVLKRTLSLIDSAILIALYGLYIATAYRATRGEAGYEEEEAGELGVAARTQRLRGARKWIAVGSFLAVGAFILYFGAEPFIDAVLAVAREVGVSEFVLIQWVAPFLSEFPESLTAFLWAGMVVLASRGLSNLISSKLNQWTLLIAAIPIAYSLSVGHAAPVRLTAQSVDEIFLTAAQSLFGVVLLLTLRFGLWQAFALLALFLVQFFLPIDAVHLAVGWVYLVLAAGFLVVKWREVRAFRELRLVLGRATEPRRGWAETAGGQRIRDDRPATRRAGEEPSFFRSAGGSAGGEPVMDHRTAKIVFGLGWALVAIIRIPYAWRARANRVVVDRKTVREKALLALLGVGMGALPLVRVFTPRLNFADYRLRPWAGWAGAASFAAGLWLLWRAHAALGGYWSDSLQLRQGHPLVTSGVYRHIRHPMYASGWLLAIAQALLLRNWVAGLSGLASFALLYVSRVPREEQLMLDRFGAEYRAYMSKTGSVVPRWPRR